MMHRRRRFSVIDLPTQEALAEALAEHVWCSCAGFRLRDSGLLFLNDSTGPDGAQEYAIVREADRCQIESITFGWCDAKLALRYIAELTNGTLGSPFSNPITNQIETPSDHGRCGLCA